MLQSYLYSNLQKNDLKINALKHVAQLKIDAA